ncbi:hypothetical protein [Streptomyces pseudovenezuelae]|uniref:hypothetical protein n=1 Tax=Streptomyces pseudovenezuelae TaxID=67350 RepID=UPI003720A443
MSRPGNHEITAADLARGELSYALPLEGWSGMTLHCQVDAIGPSELHPDLVKLEVSFPPVARDLTVRRLVDDQDPVSPSRRD